MVQDKSPVLKGCSMWEHVRRWDEGCPGQQDMLDTGSHPGFKDGDA